MRQKIIIAIDSFKGCLTSQEANQAAAEGVTVCLIAGRVADRDALLHAGFAQVTCINPADLPLSEAMRPEVAKRNISATLSDSLSTKYY